MRTLLSLLLLLPGLAAAHTLWLEPRPGRFPGTVQVTLQLGDPLRPSESIRIDRRERYLRAVLHRPDGKEDVLPRLALGAEAVLELAGLRPEGSYVLTLDSTARESVLPAGKFEQYLLEERLIDILARRVELGAEESPGRERYFRCMKALLGTGEASPDFASRPVGQELEIVPLEDPRAAPAGKALRFRVLLRGKPLAGRAVTAARRDGETHELKRLRTGADGTVSFPRTGKGAWLISLVHMEQEKVPGFEWRSLWATLSFHLER